MYSPALCVKPADANEDGEREGPGGKRYRNDLGLCNGEIAAVIELDLCRLIPVLGPDPAQQLPVGQEPGSKACPVFRRPVVFGMHFPELVRNDQARARVLSHFAETLVGLKGYRDGPRDGQHEQQAADDRWLGDVAQVS